MSCLCHKLLTRQYSSITEREVSRRLNFIVRESRTHLRKAEILKRTWSEAPHLFHATPPTPPDIVNPVVQARGKRSASGSAPRARKHPRRLSRSSSNNVILERPRDQPSEGFLGQSPSAATRLEKTYSNQDVVISLEADNQLNIRQGDGVYLRVFRAIQRADQFQRICSYVFAKLHKKGTSVDPIVEEIQDALPAEDTREKVYHFIHIGNKWAGIVEQFASIVNTPSKQLTGLLCLLGSASA